MMRPPLSRAAAGLLRSIVARAGGARHRILLIEFRSVDWQSLTFVGERHEMQLRIGDRAPPRPPTDCSPDSPRPNGGCRARTSPI